jgi:MSHA pilin protein MshC
MSSEAAWTTSNSLRPALSGGFTVIELIMVMVLVGVLSAVALPKLGVLTSVRDDAWRDSLVAGLRYASKSAVAQRRLVCASLSSNTQLTLMVASANPATSCSNNLVGLDGSNVFATSQNANATTTITPAGTIYFQPDGRATSDGAGLYPADRSIVPSGASGTVLLIGQTGHVE